MNNKEQKILAETELWSIQLKQTFLTKINENNTT